MYTCIYIYIHVYTTMSVYVYIYTHKLPFHSISSLKYLSPCNCLNFSEVLNYLHQLVRFSLIEEWLANPEGGNGQGPMLCLDNRSRNGHGSWHLWCHIWVVIHIHLPSHLEIDVHIWVPSIF